MGLLPRRGCPGCSCHLRVILRCTGRALNRQSGAGSIETLHAHVCQLETYSELCARHGCCLVFIVHRSSAFRIETGRDAIRRHLQSAHVAVHLGCGAGAAGGRPRRLLIRHEHAVALAGRHLRAGICFYAITSHHGTRFKSAVERNHSLTADVKSVRTDSACTCVPKPAQATNSSMPLLGDQNYVQPRRKLPTQEARR